MEDEILEHTNQKTSKKAKLLAASTAAFALMSTSAGMASANVKKAMSDAGLNSGQTSQAFFKDLNGIVITLMVIGGIWAVAFIIIGAMRLSASGANPQKRTEGIIALICAAVGVWVIYKAYDIASWATTLGKTAFVYWSF